MPEAAETGLDTFALVTALLGGLAVFLLGMEMLADALKAVAGERMKAILQRLTSNRFMGAATGAFVTAVIQSSSVTTVLVVGFISAGLMSAAQSVGVIMGANIGTTITAQIIAFKVSKYSLIMIAVGFGTSFLSKRADIRGYGNALVGLGLVFLDMAIMGDGMSPLRSYPPFLDAMTRMESPLLGILAAALFTALVQSSSATTGVVIVMASQGLISLPAGIALAFGANIGTCVTALLASIGKPREAHRAAVVHVLFNVVGVAMWLAFIPQLADLVTWISPAADPALSAAERRALETPRQIANAHTVFNVANTALLIWISPLFGRAAAFLVPDRPLAEADRIRAKYLDDTLLITPTLAIESVRRELRRLGDRVSRMLEDVLPAMLSGSGVELTAIRDQDEDIDGLHGHIVTYLGRIASTSLDAESSAEVLRLMEAANSLENIGDIVETNLTALGHQRIEGQLTISEETCEIIGQFHAAVHRAVRDAAEAVIDNNGEIAQRVVTLKPEINRLAEIASHHEVARLIAKEPNRLLAYQIEVDMLENLKRIYYFAKRMSRAVARHAQ